MSRTIIDFNSISREASWCKSRSQKIIFTHGVFDLLHRGHVELLVKAKKLGGVLFVGVECDANSMEIKGEGRPIHDQQARSFVISQLKPVDHVFVIPPYVEEKEINEFYCDIYRQLQVDLVATCVKAGKHGHLKQQHAAQVSAEFVDIDSAYANNTTAVLNQLK